MPIIPKYLEEALPKLNDLFIKGKELEKDFNGIAIVGTRRASAMGLDIAEATAYELARHKIPIISGMALGIDSAAHRGALKANGRTVAVLGCGTDIIYPLQNKPLYEEILKSGGSIVSEYKDGEIPGRYTFLERNKIIAGLSVAVIIIEAPLRSGSINTANHAVDFGREVLVFPGPYNHSNYGGSHKLIRDGARLVGSIDDILDDLSLNTLFPKKVKEAHLENDEEKKIFAAIRNNGDPITVDKIIFVTKLETQKVLINLAKMTVCGIIIETGGRYAIK